MVLPQSNVPKNVDGMADSVDPDQTVPQERSSLGPHCCPDLSIRKFRIITLSTKAHWFQSCTGRHSSWLAVCMHHTASSFPVRTLQPSHPATTFLPYSWLPEHGPVNTNCVMRKETSVCVGCDLSKTCFLDP